MTSTISGTASAPLPIPFALDIRAVSQRVADRENVSQRSHEVATQRAAKRKAQHEVEMLALEWNKIMLERHIQEALDPKTDARLRRDLRNDVMNRGIGRVRTQEDDEDAKQKSAATDFLEVLAALSSSVNHTPTPRIERDIGSGGTDDDLQQLLDDLDAEENSDG